jgi:hypothetical protein
MRINGDIPLEPTYTVHIPAAIDFGTTHAASGQLVMPLEVSASIDVPSGTAYELHVGVVGSGPGGIFSLINQADGYTPLAFRLYRTAAAGDSGDQEVSGGNTFLRLQAPAGVRTQATQQGYLTMDAQAMQKTGAYSGFIFYDVHLQTAG